MTDHIIPPMSLERRATLTASGVSLLLIAAKLSVGIWTGTVSLVASAIDSILDFGISFFNYVAVRKKEQPRDETYNYGRGKIEGIASAGEGLIILGAACLIVIQSVFQLQGPPPIETGRTKWALLVIVLSTLAALLLYQFLSRSAKKTGSLILEADSIHYKSDFLTNLAITGGLLVVHLTGWKSLDPLIAVAFAVYIAYSSLGIIRKGFHMLMDRALDEELSSKIEEAALKHSDLVNGLHELKTRQAGDTKFVEFHLVFSEFINLGKAHRVSDEICTKIRALDPEAKWVINVHLDPSDDSVKDNYFAKV